jgi:hypothetical protein
MAEACAAAMACACGRSREREGREAERCTWSESWKWIDAHEKELGIGRPYLDKDPPHVAPLDGKEYADKRAPAKARIAGSSKPK